MGDSCPSDLDHAFALLDLERVSAPRCYIFALSAFENNFKMFVLRFD